MGKELMWVLKFDFRNEDMFKKILRILFVLCFSYLLKNVKDVYFLIYKDIGNIVKKSKP